MDEMDDIEGPSGVFMFDLPSRALIAAPSFHPYIHISNIFSLSIRRAGSVSLPPILYFTSPPIFHLPCRLSPPPSLNLHLPIFHLPVAQTAAIEHDTLFGHRRVFDG